MRLLHNELETRWQRFGLTKREINPLSVVRPVRAQKPIRCAILEARKKYFVFVFRNIIPRIFNAHSNFFRGNELQNVRTAPITSSVVSRDASFHSAASPIRMAKGAI